MEETTTISDSSTAADDEAHLKVQRQQLTEEFNAQRAKMKDLFLQKEEELKNISKEKQQLESEVVGLRSQLTELHTLSQNQQHELQSLQMLIQETMEVSSSVCSEEVQRLQKRALELEQQLTAARQASQDVSMAPAALVQTVTRTIARKLAGEDDKPAEKVQEDPELLRPLEQEIKALKEKLRDTDTQLQTALANKKAIKSEAKEGDAQCDMCANYEKQLVAEQAKSEEARQKARNAERALKIAADELEGARSVHDETVRAWQGSRTAAAASLDELRRELSAAQSELGARTQAAQQASERALRAVTDLTVQRQTLQDKLDTLERDNAMLVGKYAKKAMEMQNEDINLPDTVEELQEYALRLREELIVCCVGRERALQSEDGLRQQLLEYSRRAARADDQLAAMRAQSTQLKTKMESMEAERQQMNELGDKLRQSNNKIEELLNDKKRSQTENHELRARVSSLQQELDNSEKVQQDFVRLSQSLQVQLERIREADTEVRWQHEEDVTSCPLCRTALPSSRRKVHCRHCGRIYCGACVSHEVPSGPRGAPARVCSVCRTLLQPHTAPYFSCEPPRAPD